MAGMKGPALRIVIMTTKRHAVLLPAMVRNLRRHWNPLPPLTVLCEEPLDLPDGVTQGRAFLDSGCTRFSGRLRCEMAMTPEPVIYLTPSDIFLTDDIDAAQVQALAGYMMAHPGIARLGTVEAAAPWEYVDTAQGMELVRCAEWQHCSILAGMSMNPALWSRENLMRLLEPGWTMWEIETLGTERMKARFPEMQSLLVRPPLSDFVNLVSREARAVYLDRLPPEDREGIPKEFNPWRS